MLWIRSAAKFFCSYLRFFFKKTEKIKRKCISVSVVYIWTVALAYCQSKLSLSYHFLQSCQTPETTAATSLFQTWRSAAVSTLKDQFTSKWTRVMHTPKPGFLTDQGSQTADSSCSMALLLFVLNDGEETLIKTVSMQHFCKATCKNYVWPYDHSCVTIKAVSR